VVSIWFLLTTVVEPLTKALKCSHEANVFACSACSELLPTSFWDRLSWRRFNPEPDTCHITTLTDCLAKSYFEQTSPSQQTVESAWAKLRGSLLHYSVRSLGWSELRAKLTFELDGRTITVVGYIDAYDPETATIYDLKTTRFVKWQLEKGQIPRENHVAQIQCYSTLLGEYGIPVDRLVLVYVDDKDIVPLQIPLGNRREWIIRRATALHRALENDENPIPEVGFACKYCPFVSICPQDNGSLKFEEAMA